MSNRLRKSLAALAALPVAALVLTACGDGTGTQVSPSASSDSVMPSMAMPSSVPSEPLRVQIYCATGSGTCYSTGSAGSGTFKARASGFTPDSTYITCATQPNGADYTNWQYGSRVNYEGKFCSQGIADATGGLSKWQWKPAEGVDGLPDPAGVYHLTIVEFPSNRHVSVTMKIPSKAGSPKS